MPGEEPRKAPGSTPAPIGVLAIQGSFALHARSLRALGVEVRFVRKPEELEAIGALVLPGGESTVLSLLMRKYALFDAVRELGLAGLPMLGTCAGAILLGKGEGIPERLNLAPVELQRNAYGTQVDSFTASLRLKPFQDPFHGVFIRAPRILLPDASPAPPGAVEVLGEHEGIPVLVAARNLLLATFHPELTEDLRLHRYFLESYVLRPATTAPVPASASRTPHASRKPQAASLSPTPPTSRPR